MINKCKVSDFLKWVGLGFGFGVGVVVFFFCQTEFFRTALAFSLELGLFEMKEKRRAKTKKVENVDQICC